MKQYWRAQILPHPWLATLDTHPTQRRRLCLSQHCRAAVYCEPQPFHRRSLSFHAPNLVGPGSCSGMSPCGGSSSCQLLVTMSKTGDVRVSQLRVQSYSNIGTVQIGSWVHLHRDVFGHTVHSCKKAHLFLSFPIVCPEPVLVK